MSKRVYVAGHNGMVGSAIVRRLSCEKDVEMLCASSTELDLCNQGQVNDWMKENKPNIVYLAAAKVGGIKANSDFPAEFIYENLMIQANVIQSSYINNVSKLLFIGSSCIYPKYAKQPIEESSLLGGYLEPTNEPYAIAKISGIKLCESYNRQYGCDYRSIMPTNLYGPGDNFSLENGHVIPALLNRFHHATEQKLAEVTIWGSGSACREFLHVDDLADACVYVLDLPKEKLNAPITQSHINIGSGQEISIRELAFIIAEITGFEGES